MYYFAVPIVSYIRFCLNFLFYVTYYLNQFFKNVAVVAYAKRGNPSGNVFILP